MEATVTAFYTEAKPCFHQRLLSVEHQNTICYQRTFNDSWTIILTDNQEH